MSTAIPEAVASLKILVRVAMADGVLKDEERQALTEVLEDVPLPQEVTIETLLIEETQLEDLLVQVTTPEARQAVYDSAYTLANIDGLCSPAEQELLDRIKTAYALSGVPTAQTVPVTEEVLVPVPVTATVVEPELDPVERERRVNNLITSRSIVTALLGAFPVPGFAIGFDVLTVILQSLMVYDIAKLYGFDPKSSETKQVRDLLIGNLGLVGVTIAVRNVVKLVPVFGAAVGGAAAFATTYAAGKVAQKYFVSGGKLDPAAIKAELRLARKEGEVAYKANADQIAERQKALQPQIQALAEDLGAGRITQEEYQRRVQELTEAV